MASGEYTRHSHQDNPLRQQSLIHQSSGKDCIVPHGPQAASHSEAPAWTTDTNITSSGFMNHRGPSRKSSPGSKPFFILGSHHCPELGRAHGKAVGCQPCWAMTECPPAFSHVSNSALSKPCTLLRPFSFPPLYHIFFYGSVACLSWVMRPGQHLGIIRGQGNLFCMSLSSPQILETGFLCVALTVLELCWSVWP